MNQRLQRMRKISVLLAVVFLTSAGLLCLCNKFTTEQLAKNATVQLQEKENLAERKLDEFASILKNKTTKNLFSNLDSSFSNLYQTEKIVLCAYKNDTLCYWSSNQPAIETLPFPPTNKTELITLRNGWLESVLKKNNLPANYKIAALISIKNEYDVENKYIQNNFSKWLGLPEKTDLVVEFKNNNRIVKSKYGNPLFEISRIEAVYNYKIVEFIASALIVLAFSCLLFALYYEITIRIKDKLIRLFIFTSMVLLMRVGMIYFKFPNLFYKTSLSDPLIFANGNSFFFSYLGDILLNSFLLLVAAVMAYKAQLGKYIRTTLSLYAVVSVGTILLITFSNCVRDLIFSLVNNSTITYNINDLFNLSIYTFVGLLSVGFLIYSFYLFVEGLLLIVLAQKDNKLKYLSVSFIFFVAFYFILDISLIEYIWFTPLVFLSYLLRKLKSSYNFINVGLIILISTILSSLLFNKYEHENKQKTYDALSYSLTDRQDIIAENEFVKVSTSIKSDERIKNLLVLLPQSAQQIEQNIRQINFTGYFERYDIVLSLFNEGCIFEFPLEQKNYLNDSYFEQEIASGSQTISDELFFIDKENKPIRYVAKVELEGRMQKKYTLYIQMEPKNTSYLGAFPDLLLDRSLEKNRQLSNTSYAIYSNNKLQQSAGNYLYPIFIKKEFKNSLDYTNYEHTVYSYKSNSTLIISTITFGFWQQLTTISYLFIFFTLLVLLSIWFNNIVLKKQRQFNSLNYRIQFVLVAVVFLSMATVVTGTTWVLNTQFETKNQRELVSKSKLILNEVQQSISQTGKLEDENKQNTSALLKKLAQLFSTDISIFDANGMLYTSSQSAIYNQGFISEYMNPKAFAIFSREIVAGYSQRENVGSLNYLSAYTPLYNRNTDLIGFINLPYFSRQKDLENDLTAYLTTLINIYTILFVIATLVSLLLSNVLTKPLRIIKQQLSKIRFGIKNEEILWKSNDEIGGLVAEYNDMLIKLEESSRLLAQSERESAWREMAKQVAHEIKNPLTPMKLNIQHLQRVVATNPEDANERVNKVADMLIEQIDTLSVIATEFSNFAKMPTTHLEKINICDILNRVAELFKQNTSSSITVMGENNLFVFADKEQCLRLFTNLIKNAEQAIPANQRGIINIKIYTDGDWVNVDVEDNGSGIADDIKEKLFTPNFTTKSTGTGLGLAMVKNSMSAFKGLVSFKTEINKGTTFTVQFPKLQND